MDPLGEFIDYAPLFSPARLSVPDALAQYRAELVGGDGSAMHALFWPGDRLDELKAFVDEYESVEVAVLTDDRGSIGFVPDGVRIVQVETTIDSLDSPTCEQSSAPFYVEVPLRDADPSDIGVALDVLTDWGVAAKIRCGGGPLAPVPRVEAVAEFVVGCIERGLAFKAMAGLNHAWSSDTAYFRHGLANLLLATTAAASGATVERVTAELTRPPRRIAASEVRIAREWFRHLGTCSFAKPLAELAQWIDTGKGR